MIELFVGSLSILFLSALAWAFKSLPAEHWQFVASIPLHKHSDGHWIGLNLTFYGVLTAISYVVSIAAMIVMAGAVGVGLGVLLPLVAVSLALIVPSSRWMAQLIEGKQHTFTVAGAVFVGVLLCPVAVIATNKILLFFNAAPLPILPLFAAMAISYAFGEGLGRVACISFGCCYGKPVTRIAHPLARKAFERLHFVFVGRTKKIAYESQLDGVPVVPIQALTATLYVVIALIAFWLYLHGWFAISLLTVMGITQLWRVYSETLRADYRGGSKISMYQILALVTAIISAFYAMAFRASAQGTPNLPQGLETIWAIGPLLALQILGLIIFYYTGRSEVTQSQLQIHVCHDKT